MPDTVEIVETTVGTISAELMRRGLSADEPVTVTIELSGDLIPGRRESRARVLAAGLADDDIDQLIKMAQAEVERPRA